MGKVYREIRYCKDCPRRELSNNPERGKYYCLTQFFSDEDHSCTPRRKTSRLTRKMRRYSGELAIASDSPVMSIRTTMPRRRKSISLVIDVEQAVFTLNRLGALTDKLNLDDIKAVIMNNIQINSEEV